ncbi:phage portal protein [Weissella paramesenteroides]|uniref:phage portal protein n=1 Tax=Weissella paramesenteroides TaxID=1249 RepID=UPI001FD0E21D|nr:phage portal protein [Weissella paramesenteroides]
MGLMDNLFNLGETRSSMSVDAGSMMPFIITNGTANPNHLVDASVALKNSDLYAVTSLISSDIAGAKFKGNSPMIEMLNQPNEDVPGYTFWQTYLLNLLLSGNAIAVIQRKQGVPVSLTPVNPASVTIDQDDKTCVITYQINDSNISGVFPQADILHTRVMAYGTSYIESLLGHSPLESLTPELQRQQQANKLSLSTMTNAISPTGLLKLPEAGQMNEDTKEAVRKKFEKSNSGDNVGRTIILDETASFSTVSINADVAQYLTSIDWGRTQISKVFGVPDSYLNGTGDQQSSLDMITSMYVNGLNRYIEPLLAELNHKLGGGIEIDMQSITDYSGQQLMTNLINLVDKGIVAPEEAHHLLSSRGLI